MEITFYKKDFFFSIYKIKYVNPKLTNFGILVKDKYNFIERLRFNIDLKRFLEEGRKRNLKANDKLDSL